jgi:glycosyltransferase involved in cell wall biosynthesis
VRVLIAAPTVALVGGIETYLRAVLPRLRDRGFELAVLTDRPDAAGAVLAETPGVPVWGAGRRPTEVLADVDLWRPDVVYAHGLQDPTVEAAVADRFPTVYFAHGYSGTCVSGTKCHSRLGVETCTRRLGLGCLALYLPRGCGGNNPLTMLRLYGEQRRRHHSLARYRAVLVASRHMVAEYRRHGVSDDRLRRLPLFPAGSEPDPHPPAPRGRSDRVLFVGRLTPLKGLRHLVAAVGMAAAELGRRLTLVVAGDGSDRTAAEADARRLGVPAEFLGWVATECREAEMRAADVLGVPSLWPEPFGLVGLEAGCVSVPAAAYAAGGIPDWLVPGISGESAPGHRPDPRELAAALVRVLADDDHRQRLRVGAWRTAREYSPDRHIGGLVRALTAAATGQNLPDELWASPELSTQNR